MRGTRDWRNRLAAVFELPGDVLADVARITVVGDHEIVVENHRGLTEYREERVVLGRPGGHIAIGGAELGIRSISPEQVIITGRIRSIEYVDGVGRR